MWVDMVGAAVVEQQGYFSVLSGPVISKKPVSEQFPRHPSLLVMPVNDRQIFDVGEASWVLGLSDHE